MSVFEALSLIVAIFAFVISCISLYNSTSEFKGEVFPRSRVILSQLSTIPTIIVGCDIYNNGAASGAISDMILHVRYSSSSERDDRGNIRQVSDSYTFYPYAMIDSYTIKQGHKESEFEQFQDILVPSRLRFTKFVTFDAGSKKAFTPRVGTYELELFWKNSKDKKYKSVNKIVTLKLDQSVSDDWAKGEVVITIEAEESIDCRKNYINSIR